MVKKIRFGIIGCGSIGQRHARHINECGELTAVCDIIPARAAKLAGEYNCRCYSSIEELLQKENKIDVISVCTPNGLHALHTAVSLRAGKHVLCEKPMALSVRECEWMIKEAEKANKRLFIVKQNRFNPPIVALKKLIDDNMLGNIYSVQLNCFWNRNDLYYQSSDWKGTKKYDGGTLFTQFSHFIDLLYWILGDVKDVCAYTNNFAHKGLIEFEDTGVAILQFESGVLGTINYTVNSYRKNMEGSITLFGEKGTVKVGGQYLNLLEYQCIENHVIEQIPESGPANDYGFYQGSMSNHDKVYENLINVLLHNGSITTNFLDGLKSVEIIERIYKAVSSNTKKTYEYAEA